jgi:hypothetical protein
MKIPKGFEPKKRKWPDHGGGNGRILPFWGLGFAGFCDLYEISVG